MRRIGKEGEDKAERFLLEQGFTIIERNFYAKGGEIDIVAFKDEVVHFIEVKYSKKATPYERITPTKLARLYKAIDVYIQKRVITTSYQLDALFISQEDFFFVENISL